MDFWTWVIAFVASMQFQQLLIYVAFGLIGALVHYYLKVIGGDIKNNLKLYLWGSHRSRTVTAFSTFLGSAFTYIFSGAVVGITWPALIGLAFTTGYALDSAINKGEKPDV